MIERLINTLKYGNGRTRRKLIIMLAILLLGMVFAVMAVLWADGMIGLAAFAVLFIDGLILFNTSFARKEVNLPKSLIKEKTKKEREEDDTPGALEWISSERAEEEPEEEEPEENPLLQYDEKKLKKIMVAYKVKKSHVTVMVDSCQAENLYQCPAYAWKDSSYVYFLVLEKEPRMIKSRLQEFDGIHIRRGMTARPSEEYQNMKEDSVVSMVFGGLLPNYYEMENSPYRREYRKNLYSAAPGIWCTSASVKNLLQLFSPRFVLEDGKTDGESIYYQEIYIARLLYWDGIYTGQEYKERVLEVLSNLAKADFADETVQEYLFRMLQKGLIPREYADFVLMKRSGTEK